MQELSILPCFFNCVCYEIPSSIKNLKHIKFSCTYLINAGSNKKFLRLAYTLHISLT